MRVDLDALEQDHRLRGPETDVYGMWVPKGTVAALTRAVRAALTLDTVHTLDAGQAERDLHDALAPFREDAA